MMCWLDTGKFILLEIRLEPTLPEIKLVDIGYSGPGRFTSLVWAENGFLTARANDGGVMVLKLEGVKQGNTERQLQLHITSSIEIMPPILDMSIVDYDYHDERHEQIFASCGKQPECSLRVIRDGCVGLETLMEIAMEDNAVTGTWAVKMNLTDHYHSFIVLSFVEKTSVLSVDEFTNVTDSVGFLSDVSTLACGVFFSDGLLVQIHQAAVRISLAQPDGKIVSQSWSPPGKAHISLGSIRNNYIVVESESCLFFLGVKKLSDDNYEVYEIGHVMLENQLSCISIPQRPVEDLDKYSHAIKAGNVFVVGTWRPSVEVISYEASGGIKTLAEGVIGEDIGKPQDVHLVKVHQRLYIVSVLRNGMLLRFEWPLPSEGENDSHLIKLELISNLRIGMVPPFLVPLSDLMDADTIVYGDKPWLLQTAGDSLSLNSLSFQASDSRMLSATFVCSSEHPTGIFVMLEDRVQLMMHNKITNVQKCDLSGTPLKILYHAESRLLLVLRTETEDSSHHDICYVDPMSGSVLSSYKLDFLERPNCMELCKVGSEQVLVVGTTIYNDDRTGRLIVLYLEHEQNPEKFYQEGWNLKKPSSQRTPPESWKFTLASSTDMKYGVSAICSYLDDYFVAAAYDELYAFRFENNNPGKVRRLHSEMSGGRMVISALTTHSTTIAVSDRRDILYRTYDVDTGKFSCQYKEVHVVEGYTPSIMVKVVPSPIACHMVNMDTAIVSYRDQSPDQSSLVFLSYPDKSSDMYGKDFMKSSASFSARKELVTNMRKGPHLHELFDTSDSFIASTASGGIVWFISLSRHEYELLKKVQLMMAEHPLTAPVLGSDSWLEHGVECFLAGDFLGQFLKLSGVQQATIVEDDNERLMVVRLLKRAGAINRVGQ